MSTQGSTATGYEHFFFPLVDAHAAEAVIDLAGASALVSGQRLPRIRWVGPQADSAGAAS